MDRYTKDDAKIYVTVNGIDYEGWLSSDLQRSIENISARFTIPVTYIPGKRPEIYRQDEIRVRINETQVTAGNVLAAEPFYKRDDCGLKIEGRSRTGDLVICSAIYKGGQWRGARLNQIAQDLCGPFDIDVVVETDVGAGIADFTLQQGETVLAALSRAARMRGVLVTSNRHGQLLLTKAGKTKSHGAIVRGQNVISMESIGTDANRHSEYIAYGQKKAAGGGKQILTVGGSASDRSKKFGAAVQQKSSAKDPEMKRYLPLVLNGKGPSEFGDMKAMAEHTMRVRRGQAYGLRYRLEGWTYKGIPWDENTRVPIYDDIAELDGEEWIIAEIHSKVDIKDGDVTDITVRPVEAYDTIPMKPRGKKGKKGRGTGSGSEIITVKS